MRQRTDPLAARHRDDRDVFARFHAEQFSLRRIPGGLRRDVWHPATDVYETADELVLKLALAGINPEEVTIECEGQSINVSGTRKGPDPGTVVTYHQMEIRNGCFERRIVLHRPFDPSGARARYKDGFLFIFVPKARKPVAKVLTVKLNTGPTREKDGQ